MYGIALVLGTVASLPLVQGVTFSGPTPTLAAADAEKAGDGWTPQPTKGPAVAELRRRQESVRANTCGWVDSDPVSGVTCNAGRTCALYTASNIGMAGCCLSDTQNCGWAKSCVDYDAYTSSLCGSDCENDSFIRKCTDIASPYCRTWTYPSDDVLDYGCATASAFDTVYQTVYDSTYPYTVEMTLPTLIGAAVTGWDGKAEGQSTYEFSYSDYYTATGTDGPEATDAGLSGGSYSPARTRKKSVSVGVIAGAVVAGLTVLFIILAVIIFLCVKKRKQRQLAKNQELIAAVQANRPQSQLPPPIQQQPHMQQQFVPPVPVQSPPPQHSGYFAPPQDQKINYQTQTNEYGRNSLVSNPSSPAPAYVQPYYASSSPVPPVPQLPAQQQTQYPARQPTPGTHEVDAITTPQVPSGQANVYEMGPGK